MKKNVIVLHSQITIIFLPFGGHGVQVTQHPPLCFFLSCRTQFYMGLQGGQRHMENEDQPKATMEPHSSRPDIHFPRLPCSKGWSCDAVLAIEI